MALESYILTRDVNAPYVRVTGLPHRPQEVRMKLLRKDTIVKGELKHANNKPAFVLVSGILVVPIDAVRKLVTKEITSGADSSTESAEAKKPNPIVVKTLPKLKYIDAIVIGALAGVGGAYLAEKKQWLPQANRNNKIYGAVIGAALFTYLLYRFKPKTDIVKIKE